MICDVNLARIPGVTDSSRSQKDLPRPRILLADDNEEVMHCGEEMLSPDYEIVGKVSDGNSICAEAQRLEPDIVVLDISMGECNGIKVARQLKQQGYRGSIVFLTIHEDPEFVTAAMATGGCAYVVKSRMSQDLVLAIKAAVSKGTFVSPPLRLS